MRRRGILLSVLIATVLLAGAEGFRVKLVDRWYDPDFKRVEFKKLLIIAITDDREVRHRFENRFVSHLRGEEVEGVTSHSMVPDLSAIEDEEYIVEQIRAEQIDGVVSVRLVALGNPNPDEESWGAEWRAATDQDGDLRTLIDDSLPTVASGAKQFGIEIALWETAGWDRVWAGRSTAYSRKQLKKGAGDFVQYVLHVLNSEDLL